MKMAGVRFVATAILVAPLICRSGDSSAGIDGAPKSTIGYGLEKIAWSPTETSNELDGFDLGAKRGDYWFTIKSVGTIPYSTVGDKNGSNVGWPDGRIYTEAEKPAPKSPTVYNPIDNTERVVGHTDNPAWTGKQSNLAGSTGSTLSPACLAGTPTKNDYAAAFANRYPNYFHGVAAIIQQVGGRSFLIGTAVLVSSQGVITAGHVVDILNGHTHISGQGAVVDGSFILAFDLGIDRFPKGFGDNIDWDAQPGAVRILAGTATYTHETLDVGAIKIVIAGRTPIPLSQNMLVPEAELAILGVPGAYTDTDGGDPVSYTKNFSICGLPSSANIDDPLHLPIVLRIGAGKYLGLQDNGNQLEYVIDTLGGDSGAPIFQGANGALVGINVGAPSAYPSNTMTKYNLGVAVSAIKMVMSAINI